MFANLNPITTIAWNSTSCVYSKTEKWVKLQEKCRNCRKNCSIFHISDRSSTDFFLSPYRLRKKTYKKKEQSATVPKDVYCYRYCFLETKECMHNEVGTCAEILPLSFHTCFLCHWSATPTSCIFLHLKTDKKWPLRELKKKKLPAKYAPKFWNLKQVECWQRRLVSFLRISVLL